MENTPALNELLHLQPIGTAKSSGIDLAFYLRTVLEKIAKHPINRIEELLPWNIAASLKTDSSQAA